MNDDPTLSKPPILRFREYNQTLADEIRQQTNDFLREMSTQWQELFIGSYKSVGRTNLMRVLMGEEISFETAAEVIHSPLRPDGPSVYENNTRQRFEDLRKLILMNARRLDQLLFREKADDPPPRLTIAEEEEVEQLKYEIEQYSREYAGRWLSVVLDGFGPYNAPRDPERPVYPLPTYSADQIPSFFNMSKADISAKARIGGKCQLCKKRQATHQCTKCENARCTQCLVANQ